MSTTRWWTRPRALLAVVVASVVLLAACSDDPKDEAGGTSSTTRSSTSTTDRTGSTTTTAPDPTSTTVGVKGETSKGVKMVEPHRAIYKGGKLYLEGSVPSAKVGAALKAKAVAVIGEQNVVDHYVIDPAAPAVTDGKVVVDEPFLFKTGSADIDPAYSSLLNLGVIVMQLNPQVKMVVRGYTDNVGNDQTNLVLSQARAQAVADWITAKGIAGTRFIVQGMGEADPVGDNNTEQGKALNRRIEVELVNLLT